MFVAIKMALVGVMCLEMGIASLVIGMKLLQLA